MEALKKAEGSRAFQRALTKASEQSLEFWVNTFCYLFEPRKSIVYPFVTFPFQDETFRQLQRAKGDVGIEKSRDMGASWMVLTRFTWLWLFRPKQIFVLISKTEKDVDKTGDPKSLMWKVDFLLQHLPDWMRPDLKPGKDRQNLHIANPLNGSIMEGCSTTGDAARGGRATEMLLDEYAAFGADESMKVLSSTQAVTEKRIFNSTPQGAYGGFYEVMHKPEQEILKIRLHWSAHPFKNPGLYTAERQNGVMQLKKIDSAYAFEDDYPFILDGKLRSPWYDRECRRSPIPQLIGQELDIDYFGSDFQFFDGGTIQTLKLKCFPAIYGGLLDYTRDTLKPTKFEERTRGPLSLWCPLTGGRPSPSRYTLGIDVSGGSGASNSVCSVADDVTGSKVAEFVTNRMDPKEFARACIVLARWFSDDDDQPGFMVWESNGAPGRNFGDEIVEQGFRNFYYRDQEERHSATKTKKPGWYTSPKSKRSLLIEYKRALDESEFVNPCEQALAEAAEYVYTVSGGAIEHAPSLNSPNPSDKSEFHGDRVIADALCWHGMRCRKRAIEAIKPQHGPNCIAARIKAAKMRTREEERNRW